MSIVMGTSAGFVTVAPTGDPTGDTVVTLDDRERGLQVTSPATAAKITEMGWYCANSSEAANFEVGLYDNNAVPTPDLPNNLLEVSRTNAKGTGAGWKTVTGLNWVISPSTTYWLGVQLDDTPTTTQLDRSDGGELYAYDSPTTALSTTWTGTDTNSGGPLAIYAVWEAAVDLTDGLLAYYSFDNDDATDSRIWCDGDEEVDHLNNFVSSVGGSVDMATSSLSFSSWIYTGDGVYGIYFSCGTTTGTNQRFYLGSNSNGHWSYGIRGVSFSNDSGAATPVVTDKWHHVVLTVEAGSNNVCHLYLNGVLDHTTEIAGNFTTVGNFGFSNYVGSDFTGVSSADEIGIWNRVLTAEEANILYNGGSGLAYPFHNIMTGVASITGLSNITM